MKFLEAYKKNRNYQEFRRKEMRKTPRWKAFFEALDDILTGKKVYDFYYDHIYCPIWRLFNKYPQDLFRFIKSSIQRSKYGISKSDAWAVNEYIYEVLYNGLKFFLEDEYGPEPINWDERVCEIHDKKLYNDAKNYIRLYEERIEADCFGDDSEFQKEFKNIIENHLEKLWT